MFSWLTTFGLTSFLLLGGVIIVAMLLVLIDEWLNNLHSKFYIPYNLVLLALALLINFRMNSSYEHYSSNSAVILLALTWLYFYLALCDLCEFSHTTVVITKTDKKSVARRGLNTYSNVTKKDYRDKVEAYTYDELPAFSRIIYAVLLTVAFALLREIHMGGFAIIVILGAPIVAIVRYFIFKFNG